MFVAADGIVKIAFVIVVITLHARNLSNKPTIIPFLLCYIISYFIQIFPKQNRQFLHRLLLHQLFNNTLLPRIPRHNIHTILFTHHLLHQCIRFHIRYILILHIINTHQMLIPHQRDHNHMRVIALQHHLIPFERPSGPSQQWLEKRNSIQLNHAHHQPAMLFIYIRTSKIAPIILIQHPRLHISILYKKVPNCSRGGVKQEESSLSFQKTQIGNHIRFINTQCLFTHSLRASCKVPE